MMIETGAQLRTGPAGSGWNHVGKCLGLGRLGPVFQLDPVPLGDPHPGVVKVLLPAFTNPLARQAFCRDGDAATRIRDRNVLQYKYFHDGLAVDAVPPYLVMEQADGGTLAAFLAGAIQHGKPLALGTLCDLMNQLIAGMEAVSQRLTHRDLKPSNILKVGDDWKIADHGLGVLAREATRAGIFHGGNSLPYLAPEAWRDKPDAAAIDIYALGMVFYELATLQPPFGMRSGDPALWKEAHSHQPLTPPHEINPALPPALSQMVMQMTARNTDDRPADWATVRSLLTDGGEDSPVNRAIREAHAERDRRECPPLPPRSLSAASSQAARDRQAEQPAPQTGWQERERQRQEAEAEAKKQAQRAEAAPFLAQINDAIIRPLEQWATERNRWSTSGKITTEQGTQDTGMVFYLMKFPDGTSRRIEFAVLLADDFQELVNPDVPRDRYWITEFPTMRNLPIRAAGAAMLDDFCGCNLILLDKGPGQPGLWMVQRNYLNPHAPQMQSRREPFPLTHLEITRNQVTVRDRNGVDLQKYRSELTEMEYPFLRWFFFDAGASRVAPPR